jgi:DNA-binding NarL/FixJ family response regulator
MHLILQDRRTVVRRAMPALLKQFGIDVMRTVSSHDNLRHACAHDTPDCALIELDVAGWDVVGLVNDLQRDHPTMRVVGIGFADVAVDTRVPPTATLAAIVAAVRGQVVTQQRRRERTADQPLTARQAQVLSLISQGRSADQIAAALEVSISTVSHHKREIFARLGARSQAQAVRTAMQQGLLQPVEP